MQCVCKKYFYTTLYAENPIKQGVLFFVKTC